MATRMQQRRGTAAQWISTNNGNGPILAPGELGIEIDTTKFKIGDGVNHWIDLNYFTTDSAQAITDQINAAIANLVDGAPALLDTLNELAAAVNDDPTFFTTIATNLSNHASDTTNIHGIADTAELATKTYVTNAISGATVDQSQLAGSGLTWDVLNDQFTVDTTTIQARVTNVSDTEIGYLNGVTSNIQDQLNDKLASADLTEAAQDAVNSAIVAGTGLDKTYDDNANTITIDIDSTVATKIYADDAVSTHNSDTTNVHGIANTADLATKTYADNAVSTHNSDTTNVHGITDTADLVYTADSRLTDTRTPTDNTVSTDKIIDGAVTSAKIANNTIVDLDISSSANIAQSKISGLAASFTAKADKTYVDDQDAATLASANSYTDGAITNLVNAAPQTLDTLKELADAIGDDPSFAVTVATQVSNAQTAAEGYADSAISTHNSDTTSVHGISDTAELATKTFAAELLTNATKSNITITGDKNGLTITAENGVADSTTDNLQEGLTNKYFTDERAQDAVGLNVGTGLTYTDATGEIKVTPNTYDAYGAAGSAQTAAEGYADSAISTHNSDTTNVHGIADTADLATKSYVSNAISGATVDQSQLAGNGLTWDSLNSQFDIDTTLIQERVANISDTEIGYLNNVSSNIQDQLDSKAPLASPSLTGTAQVENLEISGSLTFTGTATQIDQVNLSVEDSIIYLANQQFSSDLLDIGIYGAYGTSGDTEQSHPHTGLVRDASDGKWKLFSGGVEPADGTVDFTGVTYDTLKVGLIEGNVTGDLTGNVTGNVSGNAGTVTNGIYTTGSYSDPSWLTVSKSKVGLGNVDNTSDANKPISNATQTALDAKLASSTAASTYAPIASPTFTGTVTLPTGTVTSGMILDGTIVNADINASADIAATKIAGTAVTQADTATVTNTMLAGSIANSKLANSSITINGSAVSLGGSTTISVPTTATPTALGTVYAKVDSGNRNFGLGYQALNAVTTGVDNVAIGRSALLSNTTGSSNIAIGQALGSATNNGGSVGIGHLALDSGTGSNNNVAIGYMAGANSRGGNITAIGYSALSSVTTGANNTALGMQAGASGTNNITTGSNNILIGYNAQATSATVSNEITLGNSSITSFRIPGLSISASTTALTAPSFIKSGGTSSQFLKADGSIDSSTYLTTGTASSTYAPLASPALTGSPTAPTQTAGDNSTKVATTAYADTAAANAAAAIVASAPSALDTLNELAAALGNDANFASTVTTALGNKAPSAGPTFTGTVVLPSTTSIGNVSATEIGYLDGVTSAIQTQLDAKAPYQAPTLNYLGTLLSEPTSGTYGDIYKNPLTSAYKMWDGNSWETVYTNFIVEAALPSQTSNSGKYLTTDGTNASWATIDLSSYATLTGTQTLTNKTLVDPTITATQTGYLYVSPSLANNIPSYSKNGYVGLFFDSVADSNSFKTGTLIGNNVLSVTTGSSDYIHPSGYNHGEFIIRVATAGGVRSRMSKVIFTQDNNNNVAYSEYAVIDTNSTSPILVDVSMVNPGTTFPQLTFVNNDNETLYITTTDITMPAIALPSAPGGGGGGK